MNLLCPSPLAEPVEQISRNGLPRLHSLVAVTLPGGGSKPRMVVGTRADSSDSTSTGAAADSVVSRYGPIAVQLRAGSDRASVYSGATQNTGRNRAASSLVAFADPVVSSAYAV